MDQLRNVEQLNTYIGHVFNEETETEINNIFNPYVVKCCNYDTFCQKKYIQNRIRCVVENNIITMIQFN